MSYGELPRTAFIPLVTVRPGPVLHVWIDGAQACEIPLTMTATLDLIGRLAAAAHLARAIPTDAPEQDRQPARYPDIGETQWPSGDAPMKSVGVAG